MFAIEDQTVLQVTFEHKYGLLPWFTSSAEIYLCNSVVCNSVCLPQVDVWAFIWFVKGYFGKEPDYLQTYNKILIKAQKSF